MRAFRRPLVGAFLILGAVVGGVSRSWAAACDTTLVVIQAGGGDCATIQGCVNLIPAALTGNTCVDIQDSATYTEQVVVSGKAPGASGYRIVIGPQGAQSPVVTPPGASSAAFLIKNASVTLSGMQILTSNAVTYAVDVASNQAVLDRMLIQDPTNQIGSAAVRILASSATVQNSTISAVGANAINVAGGQYNVVSYSSVTSRSSTALVFTGGATIGGHNTFTNGFVSGYGGIAINGSPGLSCDNTVSFTTVTASNSSVYITNNSRNALDNVYLFTAGFGLDLDLSATSNTVTHSTMVANSGAAYPLYIYGASSNTISDSFVLNKTGYPFQMSGAHYNLIQFSTIATLTNTVYVANLFSSSYNVMSDCYFSGSPFNVDATAYGNTLLRSTDVFTSFQTAAMLMAGSSNTIAQTLIRNVQGQAMDITGSRNNIVQSSMTGRTVSVGGPTGLDSAVLAVRGSSTTITKSFFQNDCQNGMLIGSDNNTIVGSTVIAFGVGCSGAASGIWIFGNDNSFSDGNIYNREDNVNYGVKSQGARNSVARSTVTATAGWGLYLSAASSNSVSGAYVEGSTAGYVAGSTGTAVDSSVFASKTAAADGLRLTGGNVGVRVSSTLVLGGSSAVGITFAAGNSGALILSSVAVQGAKRGLHIDTQTVTASLAFSSVTFQGLPAGSTGVYFGGGTFVTTFTYFNFAAASMTVNVDGRRLGAASAVALAYSAGVKAGAAYESDPNGFVSWLDVPAAPGSLAGVGLGVSSISWTWGAVAGATSYKVYLATDVAAQIGAPSSPAFTHTGLATNGAYGIVVAAVNAIGTGPLSAAATKYTLAAAPTGLAASNVAMTSATVSWSGAATSYQLERSSGAGYAVLASTTSTSYDDAGLAAATTYYYRVLGLNGDAIATAYASTIAVVTLPMVALPGAPGTPVGTVLGASSISWNWSLASGATTHFLSRASDGRVLASAVAGPYAQTALSPNTAYGLRAAGVNAAGVGPLSAAATVYTFAAAPAALTASSMSATEMALSWSASGNPASTVSLLQRSLDDVVFSTALSAAATYYLDSGLLACTTYYYRVRNSNADGVATAFTTASGVTGPLDPAPPSGLNAAANAGGTVGLTWTLSASEGVTGYRLFWDGGTGAVSYGAALASLTSTATAFTTGVLASSAAYIFDLRAVHRCGVQGSTGAIAMSGAAAAAASVRAAIKEPDSGKRVAGNRVTILAELTAGAVSDVQQILFQYKLAASTGWTNVPAANANHPNPDATFPYFIHWDVSLLAAGSYDLRAVASDRNGPDAAPPSVRVVVDPVSFDVDENDDNGKVKKQQTISNSVPSVVETAGAGVDDPAVRVTIPAGVVNDSTATVSVTANPAISTAPPAGQSLVGSAVRIDLSNGQTALGGTATISLTYPDTVLFPSQLQIYNLNEATGQWSRDFASTVDTASRTVTGQTPHFSTFVLLQGTAFAADLDSVQAYPVPYKPNGGDANQGKPFAAGDATSGIVFANLAAGSHIKIFTLSGRLVAELDGGAATGAVHWDVRNQDGRDVASGAYFAVVSAPGHKSVVKKLVVIR